MMNDVLLSTVVVLFYLLAVYVLDRKGILERYNMSLAGPVIIWKTKRGRELIEKLARPRRFWRIFGNIAIVICVVVMISMTFLLIWTATIVTSIPEEKAPTPEMMLGIPGVNPLIPLWYGIFALVIAVVIHEFSHGILARVAETKLQSLGVLFFVIPLGAFVEPDEEELKSLKKKKRGRLFASGPAVNILFAILCAFIFSSVLMGGVVSAHEGVGVIQVIEDTPAKAAGIEKGMIITSLNGTEVRNYLDFWKAMNATYPGEEVNITLYRRGDLMNLTLVLAINPENKDKGYLGVRVMSTSTEFYHPIGGAEELGGLDRSFLIYISLPIQGLSPLQEPVTNFYEIGGFWSFLPDSLFWTLANVFYWLFWLNIMLGATNALPAVPLDGGYIFKDGLDSFLEKFRKRMKKEDREKVVKNISYLFGIIILALVLWQLIGPRI